MTPAENIFALVASAEPQRDDLKIQWVRARALNELFAGADVELPSVGRFKLDARLGAGGMGVVYSARDPELEREVAIKLVRVSSDLRRAETLAEAQALARITHPNVVAIHDVSVHDDQVVIVMEFVRGETLRAYARADGRTATEIASAYRQAAEGLAAVHRAGLIHRDFKPDNAVIGDDGEHGRRFALSGSTIYDLRRDAVLHHGPLPANRVLLRASGQSQREQERAAKHSRKCASSAASSSTARPDRP